MSDEEVPVSNDLDAIVSAYMAGVIDEREAVHLIRLVTVQDRALPMCRHALRTSITWDGVPMCILCLAERGRA